MNLQDFLFGGTANNDGFHAFKPGNEGYPTSYAEFTKTVSEIIAMYGYDSEAEQTAEIERADVTYTASEHEIASLYAAFNEA